MVPPLFSPRTFGRLLRNGAAAFADDRPPVCRVFDPAGPGEWFLCALDPKQPDRYWGLAAGVVAAEIGIVTLQDIVAVAPLAGEDEDWRPDGRNVSELAAERRGRDAGG